MPLEVSAGELRGLLDGIVKDEEIEVVSSGIPKSL